ncbi:MAG: type II secretion system secretin GspD [Myxococcaceae bacterium]
MNVLLQSSLLLPLLLGQFQGAGPAADGGVAKGSTVLSTPGASPPAMGQPAAARGKATATPGDGAQKAAAPAAPARLTPSCSEVRKNARFNVYFEKVDIEKLVQTVADATCKTFILGENIKGKISVIGPDNGKVEVTADEFYAAFLAALDANNLALVPFGKFSKVVEKAKAKQSDIPTITDGSSEYTTNEQMITRLFKIRYVELDPLRNVVQQLVSPGGDSIVFQPDTLIVNDLGGNMHRIERIVEQLDIRNASDEMRIVQIRFALASDVANTIQKLFEQKGRPGTRPATLPIPANTPPAPASAAGAPSPQGTPVTLSIIIADERTNKVIIVASASANERINGIIREIDVPVSGAGRINVYSLANATAEDLAATLQALAQGTANRPRSPAGGNAPPGVNAPAAAQRPAGASGVAATELFAGEVKISPDKATNSLVVVASQNDYRNLVHVIEKLDLPRRQVFVEAVIMEVDMTRETDVGVELHQGFTVNTSQGQALGVAGTKYSGSTPPSFSIANLASYNGFLAGIQGPTIPAATALGLSIPSFGIVIHALQTSAGVNVLSTPHLLTTDNEEAEITVGQNVPFQAGFSPSSLPGVNASSVPGVGTSSLGAAIGGLGAYYAPISRQDVALKLNIKPQINAAGNYIRMVINESDEEIVSNDPVLGPTLAKRTAKTTVVAKDQETVVIGGILQDRTIENTSKVPVLGDIPVLGVLFRESTKQTIRTNLLLFLTPYIIRDSSDFRRIFERKMAERQKFVEEFYGELPRYEVAVDFDRKAGPVEKMNQASIQAQKQEAGIGSPGDQLISPGPPQPLSVPPPPPYSPPETVPPAPSGPPASNTEVPAAPPAAEVPATAAPSPPVNPVPASQAPPYDRSMPEPAYPAPTTPPNP